MASIGRLKIFGRGLLSGSVTGVAPTISGAPELASRMGVVLPFTSRRQALFPEALAGSKKASAAVGTPGDTAQLERAGPLVFMRHTLPSVSLKKTRWTMLLSAGR